MTDLSSMTATAVRESFLAKKLGVEEYVDSVIKRLEDTKDLNAYITVAESGDLKTQAKKAQSVIDKDGEKSPVFTGIPVAIKDQIITKGLRTTCGSKILENFIPPYDSFVVKNLKDAGAIILGKTNQDEFAMGSSNEHSAYGPVRNPWDLSRVPGGSSGGSAATVAAGQATLSLGTDTGGSIRQPAALCGTFGLKPTYGRVSRYGAVAYASSLDQVGPFARSVSDLASIMKVISGKDVDDSTSMDLPVPDYHGEIEKFSKNSLTGLRVGIPNEFLVDGIDAVIGSSFQEAVETLKKLGAEIKEISLPHSSFALAAYYITAPAEASSNLARFDGIRYGYRTSEYSDLQNLYSKSRAEGFGEEVKRRIMMGSFVLSSGYYDEYYQKAQKVRTLIINDFKLAFSNSCDFIFTPVSPTEAFKLGEKTSSPLTMYLADIFTVPVNLAGLPAITVPHCLSKAGLPIGVQCIAPAFREDLLLGIASVLEKEFEFPIHQRTTEKLKKN